MFVLSHNPQDCKNKLLLQVYKILLQRSEISCTALCHLKKTTKKNLYNIFPRSYFVFSAVPVATWGILTVCGVFSRQHWSDDANKRAVNLLGGRCHTSRLKDRVTVMIRKETEAYKGDGKHAREKPEVVRRSGGRPFECVAKFGKARQDNWCQSSAEEPVTSRLCRLAECLQEQSWRETVIKS